MFDGSVGGSGVNLAGKSSRSSESRPAFLRRQRLEREGREKQRVREKCALLIQRIFRGYRCVKAAKVMQRVVFDKRHADMTKLSKLIPPEAKSKFVFHALMPMLRLFAFFFTRSQDKQRLANMMEMVLFSGTQLAACNFFHLALSVDDDARKSWLVLSEKLLSALLACGQEEEAARWFLALRSALFSESPGFVPVDMVKSGAALAHLLRRTEVLPVLTSGALVKALGSAATDPTAASTATDLVLIFCAGLESCPVSTRLRPLTCLLSTPQLCESLARSGFSARSDAPLFQRCLQRLADVLPDTPPNRGFTTTTGPAGRAPPLIAGRWGEVWQPTRRASLLGNLAAIVEDFLLAGEARAERLPAWLNWICWAKEEQSSPTDSNDSRSIEQDLGRLCKASFVRKLLQAIDRKNSQALLAVLQIYFSNPDVTGDCEPPAEVLQTLAFATPLAGRLFPELGITAAGREPSAAVEAFQKLGPPTFLTPAALHLRAFCAVYTLQLQPMYDYEFLGPANPLRPDEVELLALCLNRLTYHFVTLLPDRRVLTPAAKALRVSVTLLLRALYYRHLRHSFLKGDNMWVVHDARRLLVRVPILDLNGLGALSETAGVTTDINDVPMDQEEDTMDVDDDVEDIGSKEVTAMPFAATDANIMRDYPPEQVLRAILEEVPHVLTFDDRVQLLHNVISADQEKRRETRGPWAQASMQRHSIRRNYLVQDGFAAFEALTDEESLRDVFRVEFIGPDGEPESGIDGGGLFKEFMIHICRAAFDPEFGLFSASSDQTLYPCPGAFHAHPNAPDLYCFLGKVVGKALYEMFLLEPQFSRVFLNRLLGHLNEVDDVAALDREMHRGMIKLREQEEHVADMDLTFSVSVSYMGRVQEVDLVRDGRNVKVTRENLTRYLHLMANFKTNVQVSPATSAFLKGLQCVIPLSWLKMFDPYELNGLVSGSAAGFDVADLRRNTVYGGGYQNDSPVVQWLWALLEHQMDAADMGRFLMFITSCSRAPLLGFKTFFPKFCIHRVPDSERLPTASTCANLLKLPDYTCFESMKSKVLQAIRAESGFDLS